MRRERRPDRRLSTASVVRCRKFTVDVAEHTAVMGIINITPDSFSDGGKFFSARRAISRALAMQRDGADIIDIGAESTRPGALAVPAAEQLRRLEPVVAGLANRLRVPISVDTTSAAVAERCLELGACIINDITALREDTRLAGVIAKFDAAVVLMHMQGRPRTMQKRPSYKALLPEIKLFLQQAIRRARAAGISQDRIIIDPGIGFGKTVAHNLEILDRLEELQGLRAPVLVGASRKSFIGAVLGVDVGEREFGTAASVAVAVRNGCRIVRVHDVAPMAQVARLVDAINRQARGKS